MGGVPPVIGLDIGSITTKAVLLNSGGDWQSELRPTGHRPKAAGQAAVEALCRRAGLTLPEVARIVATGYGRGAAEMADKKVTEITCHARGAQELMPGVRMVIDIGGQDSKVVLTDGAGAVLDFVMNDKCAAGTGRFLEVMAGALEVELDQLAELGEGAEPVEISSMCTVFAESEVISLLAQDVERGAVVAGIHRAVARRVAAMAFRLGLAEPIAFTGGVARNRGMQTALAEALGREVTVHPKGQLAGALGAALIAAGQAGENGA